MSSSLRRGALAAVAIAFSIASLSACAAGNNAQTLQIQPDNASTTAGDIKVQNAIVVTQPDLESTGPAVISATLFNEGRTDQTLESVTLPGTGKTAELSPAEGGSLTVPAGGSLILGGEGNASAVLPSSREAVQDGNAQPVTFTFSETGEVSLRAIVYPAESFFEKWGPSNMPDAPGGSSEPSAESSDKPADGSADESADAPEGEETSGSEDSGSGTPTDAASASQSSDG
ncbi:DUF461 domain-containing protein [Streptomyces griseoflavus]|uniref:DUF461 domain-containing protein n=1 Tax=Streptomyces griseoflavus TaxID=35619 RepID=UPI00167EB800|nr:DUF461 domain-containing protein [Streptomyces griseoflavus]GGV48305.1 lipoprotein [Streptomyces griseoflavus]